MITVNPHPLIVAGENSFLRLGHDSSSVALHWASHWRVQWSPVGSGHALFIDSPMVDGIRILTDNIELAEYLQSDIESILYPKFQNCSFTPLLASFERSGTPPDSTVEIIKSDEICVELVWSDFISPISFQADPGFRGGSLGLATTLFPSKSAQMLVNGKEADGTPWFDKRGNAPCTSACLAWCETWYKPDGK